MIHLQEGERIDIKTRKHWFIFFRDVVGVVVITLLPFIAWGLLASQLATPDTLAHLPSALITFFTSLWLLVMWGWFFAVWTAYYLDAWVVTDRRIVNIDQKGLFDREVSTLRMERVQDVTISVEGIIATVLNFGDVSVQTAGETEEFCMKGISNPERIKRVILTNIDKAEDKQQTQGL